MLRLIAIIQGLYFLLTGVWPLISIRTFQMVTGPKTDLWLVKTVGLLIAVIGLVLIVAGWRGQVSFEVVLLGTGSAAALAAIDIIYVLRGRIHPIYLMDAIAEIVVIGFWIISAAIHMIF
jgi:hypothetical protein